MKIDQKKDIGKTYWAAEGKSSDLSLGTSAHQHQKILAEDCCTSQVLVKFKYGWGKELLLAVMISGDPAGKNSRRLSGGRV